MSGSQLSAPGHVPRPRLAAMNRRTFLTVLGASAAGASLATLAACNGERGEMLKPPVGGTIRGTVTDVRGTPQAVGRIYLLLESGLNINRYVDVDASGRFEMPGVSAGHYQVRYWGGTAAAVPEPNPNPVAITITGSETVIVPFTIDARPPAEQNLVEIYAGDNFYQPQPFGDQNALVVVKLGVEVCWYNVGNHDHTVTGGPWGDSGAIRRAGEFMWTADRVGSFGYRCLFHDAEMRALLQVNA